MNRCAHCGSQIELIRGTWTHVVFRDAGEVHHIWCHTTKAFPEDVA